MRARSSSLFRARLTPPELGCASASVSLWSTVLTARTTPLRVFWNHPTLLGAVVCSIRGPSSIGGPPRSTPLLGAFRIWSASFRGPGPRDVPWGPWSRGPLPPLPLQQGHARRRFPGGTGPPRTLPVNVPLTRCRRGLYSPKGGQSTPICYHEAAHSAVPSLLLELEWCPNFPLIAELRW